MNSENLKNNLNSEREILPADEQKVCDLIGKLDRVECPKNFDFRLKARIASADKREFQPSVWQTLRYVLPAAACVLVVAFVMVRGGMFSATNQTGSIIATAPNPNVQTFDEQSNGTQIFTVSNSSEPVIAAAPNRNPQSNSILSRNVSLSNSSESKTTFPKLSREDDRMPSKDFSVGQNRKPIYPLAINPEPLKVENDENQKERFVSTRATFDMFGITTEFVSGRLRVKNIVENTMADKAGIRVGDFIEAVDDMKITRSEMMLKSNDVRKITVLRDGKIVVINLKSIN